MAPLTLCARASGWMEVYVTILLETFRWLPTAHKTEPTCPCMALEGPSDSGLRLPLQHRAHLFINYSHRACLAIFQKCQSLTPLRFFLQLFPFGEGPAALENSSLTLSSGARDLQS